MTKHYSLLEQFKKVRVLIYGDVMLDRYFYGTVQRISPEAPVPIVNVNETKSAVGGAGNVAVNLAGLGVKPVLIGAAGDDYDGRALHETLDRAGVSADGLLTFKDRRTTVKTRIVAHQQHVVRMDQETTAEISAVQTAEIWADIALQLAETDVVIVSDYAKGLVTKEIMKNLTAECRARKITLLIDPKGRDYSLYENSTMLTPNRREAAEACRLREDAPDLIETAGTQLMNDLRLAALLITEGENGMTLFQKNKPSKHFNAFAREVYDVTGAGDTVISTLAAALGAGASLETAAEIANIAAGMVIEHFGTSAVKLNELAARLEHSEAAV